MERAVRGYYANAPAVTDDEREFLKTYNKMCSLAKRNGKEIDFSPEAQLSMLQMAQDIFWRLKLERERLLRSNEGVEDAGSGDFNRPSA